MSGLVRKRKPLDPVASTSLSCPWANYTCWASMSLSSHEQGGNPSPQPFRWVRVLMHLETRLNFPKLLVIWIATETSSTKEEIKPIPLLGNSSPIMWKAKISHQGLPFLSLLAANDFPSSCLQLEALRAPTVWLDNTWADLWDSLQLLGGLSW